MDKLFIYECNLNIESFVHMLDDPTECYKFYWLDSLLLLVAQGKDEISFDDIISGMIADAWYSVTEYHLRMGTRDAHGNSVNSIERAVNKLDALHCLNHLANRDSVLEVIGNQNKILHDEKYQISKNVPYRLLASFLREIGGNDPLWNQKMRLIAYIELINRNECLPYIIGNEKGLGKRVIIDNKWRDFFVDNMVSIRGWIQMKKIKYLQDRNPGVPGIIYKLEPENEKQRKLHNVRKLWESVMDVAPVQDIYVEKRLDKKEYEIDHFVPWSYVANDELWNLVPVSASLNASKRDKLPDWDKYFKVFALNQFTLNEMIYTYPEINNVFRNCKRDNLNTVWPMEELYIRGIDQERFIKVLKDKIKPIYDAAHIQGYSIWIVG
nr:HNH endonuclease domain-containing protein [uncultured Acetatifactor sp.]